MIHSAETMFGCLSLPGSVMNSRMCLCWGQPQEATVSVSLQRAAVCSEHVRISCDAPQTRLMNIYIRYCQVMVALM